MGEALGLGEGAGLAEALGAPIEELQELQELQGLPDLGESRAAPDGVAVLPELPGLPELPELPEEGAAAAAAAALPELEGRDFTIETLVPDELLAPADADADDEPFPQAGAEAPAGPRGPEVVDAEGAAPPRRRLRLPEGDGALLLQVAACAAAYVTDPVLSLVDTAFVARMGTIPLAAMGPNNTVFSNIIGVIASSSLSTAATRLVANSLSSRSGDSVDPARMVSCVAATTVTIGVVLAVALMAAPMPILRLVGCGDAIAGPALEYFTIRALGVPFALLLLGLQGCYHAATDTVTPLVAVLAAGGLNAFLDPLLMFTLGWGVAGAAAATVVAQVVAAGWLAYKVFLGSHRAKFGFDRQQVPPPLPQSVITGEAAGAPWRGLMDWHEWQQAWDRCKAPLLPAMGVFKAYLSESLTFMVRAVNVVLVWSLTSTAAALTGVAQTAAHQLVLSLFVFQGNAMTSFTTVGTVAAARGMASSSMRTVLAVGDRLLVYAAAVAGALAVPTYFARGPIIAFFSADPAVQACAEVAMVPMAGMVLLSWFKVLEGVLIGVGDGTFVATAFMPAFAVTGAGLALSHFAGWGLSGVWLSLLTYYVFLFGALSGRWMYMHMKNPALGTDNMHLKEA